VDGARPELGAMKGPGARHPDRRVDLSLRDLQTLFQAMVERLQGGRGGFDRCRLAGDLHMVAAAGQTDAQLLFDAQEVLIVLAE
jgi:hypothetical protein